MSVQCIDLTDNGFNFIQHLLKLVVRLQCAAQCCLLFRGEALNLLLNTVDAKQTSDLSLSL